MLVTLDLLKKYDACAEGITFFEKHFPEGAELMDLIHMPHIPYSFLHWGALHLDTTEEERAEYAKVVGVIDTKDWFQSDHVTHSELVTLSSGVINSKNVHDSKTVSGSTMVHGSSKVYDSYHVFNSSLIYVSQDIYSSSSIKNSTNMAYCSFCIDAADCYDTKAATDSRFINNSTDVANSAFIVDSTYLTNCLFCINCTNQKFYLFNKPISEMQYQFIKDQLDSFDLPHLVFVDNATPDEIAAGKVYYSPIHHFQEVVKNTEFMEWVKTLPGYDPMIWYQICYNKEVLFNE